MPNVAQLAFTQVVSCYLNPGSTPTGIVSTIGQTWTPTSAKQVNGTWYLQGTSGWWPATANKSTKNGQPVEIKPTMGSMYEGSSTPEPAIKVRLVKTELINAGQVVYVPVLNFPANIDPI